MEGGQAGAAQEPDADARRVVRTLLLPANPPVKVGALFDALGTAMVDENASGTVVVPRSRRSAVPVRSTMRIAIGLPVGKIGALGNVRRWPP